MKTERDILRGGAGEKKILRKRMKNVGFKRHNINFVMFHIKNGEIRGRCMEGF
jgi:hypothetical protein